MGFESFNALPSEQEPAEKLPESAPAEVAHVPEQIPSTEKREPVESTKFVRESLGSVSESIDRVGWTLKDRSDRGLNEFYSPNIREKLGASAHALRELANTPELVTEDVAAALNSTARAFEDFGSQQSRGPLREDSENLRRLGSSIRVAQDSLLTLSARLSEHPDEDFQKLVGSSGLVRNKMEDAMAVIARRHAAVDRYTGVR